MKVRRKSLWRSANSKRAKFRANQRAAKERKRLERLAAEPVMPDMSHVWTPKALPPLFTVTIRCRDGATASGADQRRVCAKTSTKIPMQTKSSKFQWRAYAFAVAICSALCVSGCMDSRTLAENTTEVLKTIEIDGCEYLFTEFSSRQSNNYAVAITHKGNCKSPIHHWNGGKHD